MLQGDVLPWLYERTSKHLAQLEAHGGHSGYTSTLVGNYVTQAAQSHNAKVQAYAEMIKAKRAAEKQAAEDKIAEKLRKKRERESKRKA